MDIWLVQEQGVGAMDDSKQVFGVGNVRAMHCNELFECHSMEEGVDLLRNSWIPGIRLVAYAFIVFVRIIILYYFIVLLIVLVRVLLLDLWRCGLIMILSWTWSKKFGVRMCMVLLLLCCVIS